MLYAIIMTYLANSVKEQRQVIIYAIIMTDLAETGKEQRQVISYAVYFTAFMTCNF